MEKDFQEFIELLNKHEVIYSLVGGFAVALHGYPRYTEDIDFLVGVSEDNASRLMKVIRDFGFTSLDVNEADFLKENYVVQLGFPPVRIDILTSISGITDYNKLFASTKLEQIEDISIRVIGLDDLITNKISSARDKDIYDAKQLIKIRDRK